MNQWLEFILATFACYRLSLLITVDDGPGDIFCRLRAWAGRCAAAEQAREMEHGPCISLAGLLNCPYCLGIWFSLLLALLVAGDIREYILFALGIAGAQAFLQEMTDGTE